MAAWNSTYLIIRLVRRTVEICRTCTSYMLFPDTLLWLIKLLPCRRLIMTIPFCRQMRLIMILTLVES
uniref:Uncharacterized protein n=1 Tax=Rhizophora mucronata TaxID=61149 RepID=A0A2P2N986_RHIMU